MPTRLILAASLSALTLLAQKPPQSQPAAPPASTKSASGLPANAEKTGDGTYRSKDSSGKVWIYTRTPFGYSRREESAPAESPAQASPANAIRVVEVTANSARFERATPFGKSVWTTPLDSLQEPEKAALEAFRKSSEKTPQKKLQ